jgi:hypothetical protein
MMPVAGVSSWFPPPFLIGVKAGGARFLWGAAAPFALVHGPLARPGPQDRPHGIPQAEEHAPCRPWEAQGSPSAPWPVSE